MLFNNDIDHLVAQTLLSLWVSIRKNAIELNEISESDAQTKKPFAS